MAIRYTTSIKGITPPMLDGFFAGWRSAPTPEQHLAILHGSRYVVLALDAEQQRVAGFITAIGDGVLSACIPLLEVLPEHRGRGIGSELVRRVLHELRHYQCVDLVCDAELQPFYERLGMVKWTAMIVRSSTAVRAQPSRSSRS